MSKRTIMILGIILVIATIGGLGYWFYLTLPQESEITTSIKSEKINRNILSSKTLEVIKNMNTNGNLPLKVNDSMVGNSNPFE